MNRDFTTATRGVICLVVTAAAVAVLPRSTNVAATQVSTTNQVPGENNDLKDQKVSNPSEQDAVVDIPLREIWALDMPGTHKMSAAQRQAGGYVFEGGRMVQEILQKLEALRPNQKTKSAFIVVGEQMDALREAHTVLVTGAKPREELPPNKLLTAIFFSHQFGAYVHIHSVERSNKAIQVKYRFVPHMTKELTAHLALIPLGKLPQGKYDVRFVQSPMAAEYVQQGFPLVERSWEQQVICQSFTFTVKADGEE